MSHTFFLKHFRHPSLETDRDAFRRGSRNQLAKASFFFGRVPPCLNRAWQTNTRRTVENNGPCILQTPWLCTGQRPSIERQHEWLVYPPQDQIDPGTSGACSPKALLPWHQLRPTLTNRSFHRCNPKRNRLLWCQSMTFLVVNSWRPHHQCVWRF